MKPFLIVVVCFFIPLFSFGQIHNNVWFRGTLSIPLNEKFKADAEFQHKRQNGFENKNLFHQNLMFSYRAWLHYRYNEHVKFSLSPFAYFSNYKIIQKAEDENSKPEGEIRFSFAAHWERSILKKTSLFNRTAVEYRFFQNSQSNTTRLRNSVGIGHNFSEKIKLSVFDEIFINVLGAPAEHLFDQNRIAMNLEYHISSHFKIDVGYFFITRLPVTASATLAENYVFLNLTYQL